MAFIDDACAKLNNLNSNFAVYTEQKSNEPSLIQLRNLDPEMKVDTTTLSSL